MRKTIACIAGLAAASCLFLFADEEHEHGEHIDLSKLPPAAKQSGVTYAKHIQPMLQKSCFKCHGPEKQKARLRLDTLEFLKKGSRGKPVAIKGKSAKSKMVIAVARLAEDEDERMPPADKGDPWTKQQVGLLRAWIDQGMK